MSLSTGELVVDDPTAYDHMGYHPRRLLPNGPIRFEATFIQQLLEQLSVDHTGVVSAHRRRVMEIELAVRVNVDAFLQQLRGQLPEVQRVVGNRRRKAVTLALAGVRALGDFDPVHSEWELPVVGNTGYELSVAFTWWTRTLGVPQTHLVIARLKSFGSRLTDACAAAWADVTAQLFASITPYAKRRAIAEYAGTWLKPGQVGTAFDHRGAVERQYFALVALVQRIDDEMIGSRGALRSWAYGRLDTLRDRVLVLHGRDPDLP